MFSRILLLSVALVFAMPAGVSSEEANSSVSEESNQVVSEETVNVPLSVTPAEPVPTTEPVVKKPILIQPETEAEAGVVVSLWLTALRSKSWPVLAGLSIMLLVWVFRKFALKVVSERWKKVTPLLAAGLGVLSCVGLNLASGTMVWWEALISGLTSGVIASGSWELFGKYTLKKKKLKPVPVASVWPETSKMETPETSKMETPETPNIETPNIETPNIETPDIETPKTKTSKAPKAPKTPRAKTAKAAKASKTKTKERSALLSVLDARPEK